MSLFAGPAHTTEHGGQMREFLKKEPLCDFGQINSLSEGENRTKIGRAVPEKSLQICTHRRSFSGDFSKNASTDLNQTFQADGRWTRIKICGSNV